MSPPLADTETQSDGNSPGKRKRRMTPKAIEASRRNAAAGDRRLLALSACALSGNGRLPAMGAGALSGNGRLPAKGAGALSGNGRLPVLGACGLFRATAEV